MKKICSADISAAVERLCIEANVLLGDDVRCAICEFKERETNKMAADILDKLLVNAQISRDEGMPICQDTGMAVIFVRLGQEIYVEGSLTDAINQGVRQGYRKGYLRASIVADPLRRENTRDNTPAVIHYDIIPGDTLEITVAPKGFGSENMSALCMLKPAQGEQGVKELVINTVKKAGSNPCPPMILGVGIGGSMEMAALLAKKALTRDVGLPNPDIYYADMERELLCAINELGIGPQGFGGCTTALAVHIGVFPTHIAGLPVAVNVGCHVNRHRSVCL